MLSKYEFFLLYLSPSLAHFSEIVYSSGCWMKKRRGKCKQEPNHALLCLSSFAFCSSLLFSLAASYCIFWACYFTSCLFLVLHFIKLTQFPTLKLASSLSLSLFFSSCFFLCTKSFPVYISHRHVSRLNVFVVFSQRQELTGLLFLF